MNIQKTILLLILFFSSLCFHAPAQVYDAAFYNYNNGLTSNFNFSATQDSFGFLWITSYSGLSRFNGSSFKAFTKNDGLESFKVADFFEERKGKYWVCNWENLLRFDGKRFQKIRFKNPETNDFCNRVTRYNNAIILCTNKGLFKLEGDTLWLPFLENTFKNYTPNNLQQIDNEHFVVFSDTENLIFILNKSFKIVKEISVAKQGGFKTSYRLGKEIVLQDAVNGLDNFVLKTDFSLQKLQDLNLGFTQKIKQIGIDKTGQYWLISGKDSLFLQQENAWKNMSKILQTGSFQEGNMMFDADNNLWITHIMGLHKINNKHLNFTALPKSFASFAPYSKDALVLFSQEDGLMLAKKGKPYEDNFIKKLNQQPKLQGKPSFFIKKNDQETFVVIRGEGLHIYQNNKLQKSNLISQILGNDNGLKGIFRNPKDGSFFTSTNEYFIRINGEKVDTFGTKRFYKEPRLHSISFLPNDKIIFALSHKIICLFDGYKITNINAVVNPDNQEISPFVIDNELWVNELGRQLVKYECQNEGFKRVFTLTDKNNLPDTHMLSLQKCNDSVYVFHTFSGVFLAKKDAKKGFLFKKIEISKVGDVAPPMDGFYFHDNFGYVSTLNSLYSFNINDFMQQKHNFKAYIENIIIDNNADTPLSNYEAVFDAVSQQPTFFKVPYHKNAINISFNAIYFGNQADLILQYSLTEKNKPESWVSIEQQNSINFAELNPNVYVFKIRAVEKISGEASEAAILTFEVEAPYWQTLWFRLLVLIVIGLLVTVFVRYRIEKINETNRLKLATEQQLSALKMNSLLAQMNPHFIFNSLNSIQNLIIVQETKQATRYLARFSHLMRLILESSRKTKQPLSEVVETLRLYIELEALRFDQQFQYNIEVDENLLPLPIQLPPMMIQPFIENAIWHGLLPKKGNKMLRLTFIKKGNMMFCIIEDNGVGRKAKQTDETRHKSRGTEITAEIIQTYNLLQQTQTEFEIIDLVAAEGTAAGTKVEIRITL